MPHSHHSESSSGPLQRYRARLAAGEIRPDPAQALAIEKLQSLWRALADYRPGSGAPGWWAFLGFGDEPQPPPMGIYLFGGVGRGKSMLMDMFFALAPTARKRRVHFYQ